MFITVVSCDTFETELEVENLENPNDDILTSDPVALEATAAGLFNAFQYCSDQARALFVPHLHGYPPLLSWVQPLRIVATYWKGTTAR